jgi:hypothetical protein
MPGHRVYLTSDFAPILREAQTAFGAQKPTALLLSVGNSWMAQRQSISTQESLRNIFTSIKALLTLQETLVKTSGLIHDRIGQLEHHVYQQDLALRIIAQELSKESEHA